MEIELSEPFLYTLSNQNTPHIHKKKKNTRLSMNDPRGQYSSGTAAHIELQKDPEQSFFSQT